MNKREHWIALKEGLKVFESFSYKLNWMPVKDNANDIHESSVLKIAREYKHIGYDVVVNGKLKGGIGFPDVAVPELKTIVEVLRSETREQAEKKVVKYPKGWTILFYDTETGETDESKHR